jgi:hypothetical protein
MQSKSSTPAAKYFLPLTKQISQRIESLKSVAGFFSLTKVMQEWQQPSEI